MLKLDLYPIPHPQVAGRVIDGEAVVILSESNLVNVFNPVGSRVWELCDGSRTVEEVIDCIVTEYDVDRGRAQEDVPLPGRIVAGIVCPNRLPGSHPAVVVVA